MGWKSESNLQIVFQGLLYGEMTLLLLCKLYFNRLYTIASLLERESFTHKMRDGWGLATDGKVLFGTDGTSSLYQMDPKSLQAMKTVT